MARREDPELTDWPQQIIHHLAAGGSISDAPRSPTRHPTSFRHGRTALHIAIATGQTEVVRAVLESPRVDVNARCVGSKRA